MWIKKGLIFNVNGDYEWNKSHAQVPVVDVLEDCLRVYYSTRNSIGKSNISYIEIDKRNPSKILYEHQECLFNFGKIGTFDDSGIMPTCILNVGNKKYLYYIGWTTRATVPYHNSIGLAISIDGGKSFQKYSEGPIITVNTVEPYFSGTAFVMHENNTYRMWYLSCIGWITYNGKPEPVYNLKYAESVDGIAWEQTGKVAVPLEKDEGGLVSAAVINENNNYKMWFGKRGKTDYRHNIEHTYRIGYAESKDGIHWIRKDQESGIELSFEGWDAKMISYPYVVRVEDRLLMFYNGNGFGKSGFGWAEFKSIKKNNDE